MSSNKPIFVLVPGNFLSPSYYANTAKLLESHGFQVRIITLPSTGSMVPLTSNEPDTVAVRQVLEELSNSGIEIIVVAHSYGSVPTCEAVKGFGSQERLRLGKSGGVRSNTPCIGSGMATTRRREPSGHHCKVQDASSVSKIRGEPPLDLLYFQNIWFTLPAPTGC